MLKFIAEGMDAKTISSTALTIMSGFIILTVGGFILFDRPIAKFFDPVHAESVRSLFLYLPVMLAVTIYRLIAAALFQAKFNIKNLFWTDAVHYGLSLLLIIVGRFLGILTDARVVIHIGIVASVISSIFAYYLVRPFAVPVLGWNTEAARKIFNFGKYGLAGTIGNVAHTQFDTLILSAYAGVAGVAIYGAAKTFTRVFDIYTQVILTLVLPASSMLHGKGEKEKLTALIEKALCFSFYAILPAIIIFELFPDLLFGIIYKGRYGESIPVLRILTLLAFFVPLGSVISSVMYGIGKVNISLYFSVISLVLSLGIYTGFGSLAGVHGIAWGVFVVQCIMIILAIIVFKKYVSFSFLSTLYRTQDIINYLKKIGRFNS